LKKKIKMKFILLTLAALVACASASSILGFDASLDEVWAKYQADHGKNYELGESVVRRAIFEKNVRFIEKHNGEASVGKHTYTVGLNKFADMSNKEFRTMYNKYNSTENMKSTNNKIYKNLLGFTAPDSVDWRQKGYVTPIKDQGQCGSCWAFSTVVSLEGQHFKKEGKLVSLSEQNLVDCSRPQGNLGCDGGLMDQGFDYIKSNGGIDTEESYPYKAVDGQCKFNKDNVGATLTGYTDVKSGDEDALVEAIATQGPISVAIDASHMGFQLYKSGVYNQLFCSSSRLDHGVAAVGYGSEDGKDFYIVKNSWGTVWGMDGYILMSRNKKNQCGIATQASFPTV
jgi:cathepsin L